MKKRPGDKDSEYLIKEGDKVIAALVKLAKPVCK